MLCDVRERGCKARRCPPSFKREVSTSPFQFNERTPAMFLLSPASISLGCNRFHVVVTVYISRCISMGCGTTKYMSKRKRKLEAIANLLHTMFHYVPAAYQAYALHDEAAANILGLAMAKEMDEWALKALRLTKDKEERRAIYIYHCLASNWINELGGK